MQYIAKVKLKIIRFCLMFNLASIFENSYAHKVVSLLIKSTDSIPRNAKPALGNYDIGSCN